MNKEPALLSGDPNRAIQDMMENIDRLRNIYIEETKALNAADTRAFMNLQEQKLDAAYLCRTAMDQLVERRDEIQTADLSLRGRLKEMQADFSDITVENLHALQRMQRCTQMLSDTLRETALEEIRKRKTFSYAENGVVNTAGHKVISTGVSTSA